MNRTRIQTQIRIQPSPFIRSSFYFQSFLSIQFLFFLQLEISFAPRPWISAQPRLFISIRPLPFVQLQPWPFAQPQPLLFVRLQLLVQPQPQLLSQPQPWPSAHSFAQQQPSLFIMKDSLFLRGHLKPMPHQQSVLFCLLEPWRQRFQLDTQQHQPWPSRPFQLAQLLSLWQLWSPQRQLSSHKPLELLLASFPPWQQQPFRWLLSQLYRPLLQPPSFRMGKHLVIFLKQQTWLSYQQQCSPLFQSHWQLIPLYLFSFPYHSKLLELKLQLRYRRPQPWMDRIQNLSLLS